MNGVYKTRQRLYSWLTLTLNPSHVYTTLALTLTLTVTLSPYVWTDRLIVNAQDQEQVIYINLLQYNVLINTSTGIIVDLNNLRFKWHNN